jgi:NADH-quinone oxidoreductase subunit N
VHTVPVSFSSIAPEIVLLVCASVLLTCAIFLPEELARRASAAISAGAFLAAGAIAAAQFHDDARYAFDHTLRIDSFGQGGRLIVLSAGLLAVAVSWGLPAMRERGVEYHALLLAAAAGMSLLCVANSFVTLFVALELFSVALYVLVAIDTEDLASLEGGLKYLIVGSVGAAFLLYGSALVYGATGQLEFDRIAAATRGGDRADVLLLAGIALVVAGLGFKANAAPFHMWTPDVYEGAPTPVTAFMAAATKAVALVVMLRVLVSAFPGQSGVWEVAVGAIAIASFVIGNLAALQQRNVKRMLAYSTVGHSGFLLTAVAAHSQLGTQALLYYLAIYSATNMGAFAIVAVRERELGKPVEIADFAGWAQARPLLSAAMIAFMLALAGFPLTGGFIGKLNIFSAAVDNGQTYLAIAGVFATVVALVYYLRIPAAMLDSGAAAPDAPARPGLGLSSGVALAAAAVVIGFGVLPAPLVDLARDAGRSLLG